MKIQIKSFTSFKKRQDLERHINGVHQNLRPFECDICGDSFTQQNALDDHKAAKHANLKLLECPDCDEKFKHFKELENHIKSFHTVTDHRCSHCKKYFSCKSALNIHIDKCLNIRKHKCPKCQEAFFRKHHLENHMERKHSDERNHICDVEGCGKAFKTEVDLRNHKKTHSDKKLYKCPYCPNPKEYKYFQALRTHVFKKHPEEYKEENDPKIEE